MRETGENYTTALANLQSIAESSARQDSENDLPEIRDLLFLAHDLPLKITQVKVKTTQRWGRGALQMAERRQASLGRVLIKEQYKTRGPQWTGETWMGFNAVSWGSMFGVAPSKWREEGRGADEPGPWQTPPLSAFTGTFYWQDGPDGLSRAQTGRMQMGPRPNAIWVCDAFWTSNGGALQVESLSDCLGRSVAVVLFTPLSNDPSFGAIRPTPRMEPGDEHRIAIDLETGISLKRTSYFEGHTILEREVTELSFPDGFDDELFEPPPGREIVERAAPRTYRDLGDLAADLSFPLLVPRLLPDGVTYNGISFLRERPDGTQNATLVFKVSGLDHETFNMNETTDSSLGPTTAIAWEKVDRNGQELFVSNLQPGVAIRDARLTIGKTQVFISGAFLRLEDLISFALSLEEFRADR